MTDDEIHALLQERIDIGGESVGYVAALIDDTGSRIVTAGRPDTAGGRDLDADTVFEVGSITKVFTALLLADMVQHDEVALSDPVAKYLPVEGRPRSFDNAPITLLDLATYTSGLPRLPRNFAPKDKANPYADYSVAQLYDFLSSYTPRYYPGSHYEYANLGFGLLGHALALHVGRTYEELVVSRICDPLGLDSTRITLTPDMLARLVPGHDSSQNQAPNWDLPTLAGAGALRSTANDMVRFLNAATSPTTTAFDAAFATLLKVRRQTDAANEVAAAGWFVRNQHNDELVYKDGATGGYSSFIGYSTRNNKAVVLLANMTSGSATRRIGWHLINPQFVLPPLLRQVAIDADKLPRLAGRYRIRPDFELTVTPRNGHLMVRATNQDEFEVFPLSETEFFYRVVEAQLTFELAPDGTASVVVLHQNGRNLRGERIP